MAELNGCRISAVLSADTALKVGPLAASTLDTVLNELAYALDIDGLERIGIENLVSEVVTHKCTYIVAAEAEGHLGKVVCTEGEELGGTGHTVRSKGCAGDLDHCAEVILDLLLEVILDLNANLLAVSLLELKLAGRYGNRNHNLGLRMETFLLKLCRGGEDCPVLSLGDKRIGNVETHSPVAHHRVDLVEVLASLVYL